MIIGVDFHGVIQDFPEICRPLMKAAAEFGHQVIVITGPPKVQAEQELHAVGYVQGVHYDFVVSVVDWLRTKGYTMEQDAEGNWWTSEKNWWGSKAKICDELKVGMMFDDSEQYEAAFEHVVTKFVLIEKPREN